MIFVLLTQFLQYFEITAVLTPQMRKLRCRDVKSSHRGHTVSYEAPAHFVLIQNVLFVAYELPAIRDSRLS